jgi:hypothetical protein
MPRVEHSVFPNLKMSQHECLGTVIEDTNLDGSDTEMNDIITGEGSPGAGGRRSHELRSSSLAGKEPDHA